MPRETLLSSRDDRRLGIISAIELFVSDIKGASADAILPTVAKNKGGRKGRLMMMRGAAAYWIASFLPALAAFFGSVSSRTPLA